MKTLVVGATGGTGRHLVDQLLKRGEEVVAVVRSRDGMPDLLRRRGGLDIVEASILELSDRRLAGLVEPCRAVASCLGHNLTLRGVFGRPRRLVTEATRQLCRAIDANQHRRATKFVLMNTAGNSNRDIRSEKPSSAERLVLGLIRLLLPPHSDNEDAADYLRKTVGRDNPRIQWAAVRPDTLIDSDEVSAYEVHHSPVRSAIFDAGRTSRINVADFMARLVVADDLWDQWKYQMPVIYDEKFGQKGI